MPFFIYPFTKLTPNPAAAGNDAMTRLFHAEALERAVPEPRR